MANLTVTAADVAPVQVIEKFTGPAAEVITKGQYVRLNTTTGKIELGNATSDAEQRRGGIAIEGATVANLTITAVRKGLIDMGDAFTGMAYDADVYLSDTDGTLADGSPAVNEAQTVTITGTPTGGDFTLTFDGQTTAAIAYNAAASAVLTALRALNNIDDDDVSATGGALPGTPVVVTFAGKYAGQNVPVMTASGAGLTGGTAPAVAVTTSTPGIEAFVVGTVVPAWGATTADKLLRVDL